MDWGSAGERLEDPEIFGVVPEVTCRDVSLVIACAGACPFAGTGLME